MTIRRIRICRCGHEEAEHDGNGCHYGNQTTHGGCDCDRFRSRKVLGKKLGLFMCFEGSFQTRIVRAALGKYVQDDVLGFDHASMYTNCYLAAGVDTDAGKGSQGHEKRHVPLRLRRMLETPRR